MEKSKERQNPETTREYTPPTNLQEGHHLCLAPGCEGTIKASNRLIGRCNIYSTYRTVENIF